MSRLGTVALFFAAASVVGVGAERYSKNARGEVVETRPAALVAIMTEVGSGDVAGSTRHGIHDGVSAGPERERDAANVAQRSEGVSGVVGRGDRPSPQVRVSEANRETLALAEAEAARVRPIRKTPRIVRVANWLCRLDAPGATVAGWSTDGNVASLTRPANATWPCPHPAVYGETAWRRWGRGTDSLRPEWIIVEYRDGDPIVIEARWPAGAR